MRLTRTVTAVAGAAIVGSVFSGCGTRQPPQSVIAPAAVAPAACRGAIEDPTLRAVLQSLDRLRSANPQTWDAYKPGQSTYVFLLRDVDDQWCGVIWNAGAVSTIALAAAPSFSTPMYGFHMAVPAGTGATEESKGALKRWTQAPALGEQLERMGLRRAVLVPLRPEIKLPFDLKAPQILDIAVHEAVHLNVQVPSWTRQRGEHSWPAWTEQQPDRPDLALQCYGAAGVNVTEERGHLVDAAMAALTGGSREQVCARTRGFADSRRQRWSRVDASNVTVKGGSSAPPMSCRQGEAVMELTEGLPDFVYWMSARRAAVVTEAQVKQRFMAQQRDVFYLTGSMQLVVLRHLLGERAFARLPRTIGASSSWRDGELFAAVGAALKDRCDR